MNNEKFCLRWNDFEGNISAAFRELREDKDFFDVTIACDDEQIQAHKVILSACSPFFRNVLRRNPHQHPLLYLKGVKYTDFQAVLNFMYQGEVNVAQEELNSFLAVAEDLKVKGLTQNNEKSEKRKEPVSYKSSKETQPTKTSQRRPDRESEPPKYNRPEHHLAELTAQDAEMQEVVPIKSEPRDIQERNPTTTPSQHLPTQAYNQSHLVAVAEQENTLTHFQEEEEVYEEEYEQYEEQYGEQYGEQVDPGITMGQSQGAVAGTGGNLTYEDLNQYIGQNPDQKDYYCTLCPNFQAKKPPIRVRDHLEAIHFPGQFIYACGLCEKTFNGKNLLANHKSTKHSKKKTSWQKF